MKSPAGKRSDGSDDLFTCRAVEQEGYEIFRAVTNCRPFLVRIAMRAPPWREWRPCMHSQRVAMHGTPLGGSGGGAPAGQRAGNAPRRASAPPADDGPSYDGGDFSGGDYGGSGPGMSSGGDEIPF